MSPAIRYDFVYFVLSKPLRSNEMPADDRTNVPSFLVHDC
jgi:hypothetical protein